LDYINRPYYENGDHTGNFQQFCGSYHYNDSDEIRPLFGKRLVLFNDENNIIHNPLYLYELDEDFNKKSFFKGNFTEHSFKGDWHVYKTKKTLKFNVQFDLKKFTEIQIKTSKGNILLPINHINKFNQNEYKILKVIEKEDVTFVLMRLNLTNCSVLKARGSGCGDIQKYLRLYEIKKNEIKFSEYLLDGSADEGYHFFNNEEKISKNKYIAKVVCLEKDAEVRKLVVVDFKKIYKGIKVIKY